MQANSLISKLALLTLHFPRLRLVWSRSLHATAAIFHSLNSNQDDPDPLVAASIGFSLLPPTHLSVSFPFIGRLRPDSVTYHGTLIPRDVLDTCCIAKINIAEDRQRCGRCTAKGIEKVHQNTVHRIPRVSQRYLATFERDDGPLQAEIKLTVSQFVLFMQVCRRLWKREVAVGKRWSTQLLQTSCGGCQG